MSGPASDSADISKPDAGEHRRSERRRAIIEAAAIRFASHGYGDCEMSQIAADCGIAKGTVYLYFPGKQELFFACTDWGMRQLQQAIRAAADRQADLEQKIESGIAAYLQFFDEHPEYAELLIQERAIFKDRRQPTYFEHRDNYIGYWRDVYRQLADAGRIRRDISSDRIVDLVGSLLYGTMFLNHFVGRHVTLEEQYRTLLQILFGGLRDQTT